MAIFSHSAIISEISGKLGANVYARNRYGPFVRVNTPPFNPDTLVQQDWRARFTAATQLWKTLTEAKRKEYRLQAENYNTRTRLGRKGKTNGFLLFVRQQILASKVSLAGNTDLTPPKMSGRYSIDAIDLSRERFLVTITNKNALASTYFTLMATPPLSPGIFALNPSTLRVIIESAQIAVGTHVYDFTAQYVALYGAIAPEEGKKVFAALQSFNYLSGERGRNYFLDDIITDHSPRIIQTRYINTGSVASMAFGQFGFTTPPTEGNKIIVQIATGQQRDISTPVDFTLIGPQGTGTGRNSVFDKVATNSEPATWEFQNLAASAGSFQVQMFEVKNISSFTKPPSQVNTITADNVDISTSTFNAPLDAFVIAFAYKGNLDVVSVDNDFILTGFSQGRLCAYRLYTNPEINQNANLSWLNSGGIKINSFIYT